MDDRRIQTTKFLLLTQQRSMTTKHRIISVTESETKISLLREFLAIFAGVVVVTRNGMSQLPQIVGNLSLTGYLKKFLFNLTTCWLC